MPNILTRFRLYLRERRFERSLKPGWLSRDLKVPKHAADHGALGPELAAGSAGVEDAIDGWGVSTLAARHKIAAEGAAAANGQLEKCRFGEAEKGYSNILQRYAARVKKILADTELRLREAQASLVSARTELRRHCLEIGAAMNMAYRERPDGLWKAFALAISIEALAGAIATAEELGLALSLFLCAVLGGVVFMLGAGGGWALQRAWVSKWLGRGLFALSFATAVGVIGAFCVYRLQLAELTAQVSGLKGPAALASAAALPPLVLLLAVAGLGAWAWTAYVWIDTYGVAPGVRRHLMRSRKAERACAEVAEGARERILRDAETADFEIDAACAQASQRRRNAVDWGSALLVQGSTFDREREAIFATWGATHGEFTGIVVQMSHAPRDARTPPDDYPVIPTGHVAATVEEVERDADALMIDEGKAKLALAATCSAGLRDLDRLKAGLSDLTSGKDLLS